MWLETTPTGGKELNETDEKKDTQAAPKGNAKGVRAGRVHHRGSNRSSHHRSTPLKVDAKSRAQGRRKAGGSVAKDLKRTERNEPRGERAPVDVAPGQSQRQREEQHGPEQRAGQYGQQEHGRGGIGEFLGNFVPSNATRALVEETIQRVGMALLAPPKRKQMRKKLKKVWREHGSELLATVATALLTEVVSAIGGGGKKKKKKKKH